MTRSATFSLRRLSLSSAMWFAVVLAGWPLILVAAARCVLADHVALATPLAMTGVLLVLLELLPLVQGRGHDPQGVVMSTAFTMAMLTLWGVWPAATMIAIASVSADLRARKNWWKVLFNPAQYALSVGAAYIVLDVAGRSGTLGSPLTHFGIGDMPVVIGAWVAYFVTNLVLVAAVVSFANSFWEVATDDLLHAVVMTFAVLAVSPLIVVVARTSYPLMPLLLVPLLLLYYTAQMSLQREHAAGHDPLTGLANRATLQFELQQAFARYRRDEVPFGLILIDLDDFKRVNDTLGHPVGDELLCRFSERLANSVRAHDRVARLGGDEFAVIVFDAEEADVWIVADRIHSSVATSIELSGISLELELSLGIALCPRHGTDADTLLQRADVAMYVAKDTRTVIEVYSPDIDKNSADHLSLLAELRQALESDVIELHYQPKVMPSDGSLLGVEALVRWQHPVHGFVPPDRFVPLAERSGIMPLLTGRVIRLAIAQMAEWAEAGFDVPIAVNIAPTDLVGAGLADLVESELNRYDLRPEMLQLEITERVVTHHLADAQDTLNRLRALGVGISLDDFGTGYSSLLRLSTLPVDEIKVDRAFVSELSSGERAVGIVRAMVDLAHALGVPAIAEGVETETERAMLHGFGCDGIQGWFIARPMDSRAATAWLHEHAATHAGTARATASPGYHRVAHRDLGHRPALRAHRSEEDREKVVG